MDINRREFFKFCGVGVATSSLAALGMTPEPAFAESVRHFKLANTKRVAQHLPLLFCGLWPHHVQPWQWW